MLTMLTAPPRPPATAEMIESLIVIDRVCVAFEGYWQSWRWKIWEYVKRLVKRSGERCKSYNSRSSGYVESTEAVLMLYVTM